MFNQLMLQVKNPSTGVCIDNIVCDGAFSIEEKIGLCHLQFSDYKNHLPVARRIAILESVVAQLQNSSSEVALLIAQEGGKPLTDAIVEVDRAAFGIKLAIAYLLNHGSSTTPLNTFASEPHYQMEVTHQAIGPAIWVSAFNHPLHLVTHQLVSAFAAGCPCIVKPAFDTPLSCIKLVEFFHIAGTPPGWVDYVITSDNVLAESMVTDPRFAFFSFIGSAKVGWYLRSKLPPGTRCALEHGGVAPAFVDETADLDSAVNSLLKGAYYHAGQVCVSTQRIYIEQSIFDSFAARFSAAASELFLGDASLASTQVGPLIRQQEVERVENWVNEARSMGAKILTGGKRFGHQFYLPTVIANAPETAKVNQLEVFGPVCSLMPYSNLEEQISKINNEPHCFHSAVFSDSEKTIQTLYKRLQTGCLMVNEHTAFRHDAMTFAGLKQSGLGAGGIPNSIHHMQVEKIKITRTA